MRNGFRMVVICILLSITLFSPFFIYKVIVHGKNIYYARDYVKMKIKVDSVNVEVNNAGDGNIGTGVHHIYNYENNLSFSFTDRSGHLFGDDGIVPHMYNYMEHHHDSILIWFNPNAKIQYARDEESDFSIGKDFQNLLIFGILVIIGIFHGRWQIQNYKKKKAQNRI